MNIAQLYCLLPTDFLHEGQINTLRFVISVEDFPLGCVTESWTSCVFPFKYAGKTYSTCTTDGSSKAWCSIENKADGNYKYWDYCAMETCSEVASGRF